MEMTNLNFATFLKLQSPKLFQILKMSSEMIVCGLNAPIATVAGYEK